MHFIPYVTRVLSLSLFYKYSMSDSVHTCLLLLLGYMGKMNNISQTLWYS